MTTTISCDFIYPNSNPFLIGFNSGSHGVSEESEKLHQENHKTQQRELERAQESGLSRANNASSELQQLYKECCEADWNGREAEPISFFAISEAQRLIAQIPDTYPMPEIIPESTGEVGLEWYVDPYKVLLLSVAGDGYIYYAGLYGFKNADYGSKPFGEKLHRKIISLLEDIYKEPGEN